MKTNTTTFQGFKYLWLWSLVLSLNATTVFSQYLIQKESDSGKKSIHHLAEYVDLGAKERSFEEVKNTKTLAFSPMPNENTDFGFTTHHIWVRFQLENGTNEKEVYFLETARPITDVAELYVSDSSNTVQKFQSGDAIPYAERSFQHRKTIFKIVLEPHTQKQFYLHVKSDGEMLSMPMLLYSMETLIQTTSFEQFVFGFFYGILIIAAILYLFFFFAMRDKTFLYYSMYVVFIGLLQFSIDGYFYQLITPQSGWLSLHAVIIFACIANFFLGRYAQVFLKIKEYNKTITYAFYTLYVLNAALFLSLFVFPNSFEHSYPIANALGLIVLSLIIASQIAIYRKTKKIDRFFATGIVFLISGFVIFILKNFSLLPLNFWTENGSKLGTGMEVIFLSLSMANLIRNLKNEREQLQTLALQRSEEMNELKSYFLSN
ncbi:7TMR-DISM family protein, partial [Flavobacterium sp.]|uniref:7TMR-DISM family protein n=1 Tax=Flavobacterium sp. TaxID=239 RepID=UPI002FDCEC4D